MSALVAIGAGALTGCASIGIPVPMAAPDTRPADAGALRAPGAATAPAPASSNLRPFADVVRGARRSEGLFAVWQKDDKVWLEVAPEDLNRPFFLSAKLKTGIGERSFLGGSMAASGIVEFRRVHNQIQLLWRNVGYTAAAGTPEARAVEAAYSPSLLASAAVASAPEPQRKAVLIEANAVFMADLLSLGMDLQRAYRQSYAFDPRNSAITEVRAGADLVVLEVLSHFATGSISVPTPGGAAGPSAPRSLPDPRSLFMTVHYSIGRVPDAPMQPRRADPRVGFFDSSVVDYGNDLERSARRRHVNRWRLEKADPSSERSEPVKPIVYWLDRSVPYKYRAAITEGVLEWNKAFERIGFKDAIRVEVQPEDADFDTLDFGRASIRWVTNAAPTFLAIGPSHVDPRSGEILDADISIESFGSRDLRAVREQILAPGERGSALAAIDAPLHTGTRPADWCTYASQAAEQMAYAFDVFEARGELDLGGEETERFIHDFLKSTTMHEVGHTLGLRHNFRASRVYTPEQLADRAFTAEHGVAGSVMEYAPINLGGPAQPRASYGVPFSRTLGPYDYWAIEYAYKPLDPALTADGERRELERIASRSSEPLLAFGTDEDHYLGVDPESLQFDLGSDVVAFARKRISIAQELLSRQETRELRPGQDYNLLRRSVSFAVRDVARAGNVLVRQIGGVRTVRDLPGTGRDPLTPVPAEQQRAALELITKSLLAPDSLRISPALQRRLGADFLERGDAVRGSEVAVATDYSLSQQVLDMQRALLGTLLSDTVATRLLDSAEKAPSGPGRALRLGELYAQVTQAVWSELAIGGEIPSLRRELQRDYVNRVSNVLLRPASATRADTRGLVRMQANALLARLRAVAARPDVSDETRAHLQDSTETLAQALAARLERQGA
ncbi:zinc-dependent metalloprotease [Piscinibacter koreensis]|uniref:zinc-dependent metalloprotease n=1 Tax=Piscinibacter koreensis TaxID=2742824 RepID=UPI003158463C